MRQLIKGDVNLNNPIHLAAAKDGVESLELLLQYGANPEVMNRSGKSPLMIAAATGRKENVEFLISSGADPLVESASGYNAWMYAASGGHNKVLEFLIQKSAIQIEHTDKIHLRNALHLATIEGHLETIKFLISFRIKCQSGGQT